jgi:hypothetical protein
MNQRNLRGSFREAMNYVSRDIRESRNTPITKMSYAEFAEMMRERRVQEKFSSVEINWPLEHWELDEDGMMTLVDVESPK